MVVTGGYVLLDNNLMKVEPHQEKFICQYCLGEFVKDISPGPKPKFHSQDCKDKYHYRQIKNSDRYKHQCDNCFICFGSWFEKQKYCTKQCAEIARTRKRIKECERRAKIILESGIKECSICKKEKPIEDFWKSKTILGLKSTCKKCDRKRNNKWARDNQEHNRKRKREWSRTENGQAYRIRHLPTRREWERNRAKTDLQFRLNRQMRASINNCFRNGNGAKNWQHWEDIVGYTWSELKNHLQKQFHDGMNWGNYGKTGWHIDHIIPISAFNFVSVNDIDFKKCWALKNLQPMWAKENIVKGCKLEKPFQPTLAFGGSA